MPLASPPSTPGWGQLLQGSELEVSNPLECPHEACQGRSPSPIPQRGTLRRRTAFARERGSVELVLESVGDPHGWRREQVGGGCS